MVIVHCSLSDICATLKVAKYMLSTTCLVVDGLVQPLSHWAIEQLSTIEQLYFAFLHFISTLANQHIRFCVKYQAVFLFFYNQGSSIFFEIHFALRQPMHEKVDCKR